MSQEEIIFDSLKNLTKIASLVKDDNLMRLLESQEERLVVSSFSMSNKEKYCGHGMLLQFILDFTKNTKFIKDTLYKNIDARSAIKCAIIADIGRLGTLTHDRFVVQISDWHREKLGQYFTWNEECMKYSVSHMSLFYANNFNVQLTEEEFVAILLCQNKLSEDNKFYQSHESNLAKCLTWARDYTLSEFKNPYDNKNLDEPLPF